MGQPKLLPETNVLLFPQSRADRVDARLREEPRATTRGLGAVDLPPGFTLKRVGPVSGYLVVPLHSRGKDPKLGLLSRREANLEDGEHSRASKSLSSSLLVRSRLRLIAKPLSFAVLLPLLALGALLWLGQTGDSSSRPVAPPPEIGTKLASQVTIFLPVVSTPTTVSAVAGQHTMFPITIERSDPGPGDMIIISRLPPGSTFSAGMPQGQASWRLGPSELGDLRLLLPKDAHGEAAFMVQLLAPSGHVISDTATIVEVTGLPERRISVRRVKTEVIPARAWEQLPQDSDTDADASSVEASRAVGYDPVPLPDRRPLNARY